MVDEYLKELIRTHPVSMHSPYYSNPCSKTCKVCNMDKELYDEVRATVKEENNILLKCWIVQLFYNDYNDWFDWSDGSTYPIQFRFTSLKSAKEAFEKHKNSFYFVPTHYRFVKISIEPEKIVEREIEETYFLSIGEIT